MHAFGRFVKATLIMAGTLDSLQVDGTAHAVLARIEDAWQIAFVVDKMASVA